MLSSAGSVVTKCYRLGGLTKKTLFLPVLEAGSPRSRCWQDLVFGEGPPGLQMAMFSLCPHMAGRGEEEEEGRAREIERDGWRGALYSHSLSL